MLNSPFLVLSGLQFIRTALPVTHQEINNDGNNHDDAHPQKWTLIPRFCPIGIKSLVTVGAVTIGLCHHRINCAQ